MKTVKMTFNANWVLVLDLFATNFAHAGKITSKQRSMEKLAAKESFLLVIAVRLTMIA